MVEPSAHNGFMGVQFSPGVPFFQFLLLKYIFPKGFFMNTFKLICGKLQVTDPCYDIDTWCTATLENVKNGKYISEVTTLDAGPWGDRISELAIFHEDFYNKKHTLKFVWRDSNIGVDSGQAGFFDYDKFKEAKQHEGIKSVFYEELCNITLNKRWGCPADESGVVSSSGYGDGVYSLYVAEKNAIIVAAKIIFIDENNNEMEEF